MIRKGKYAIHNGSEYSFSPLEHKSIRLISNKHADLSQGFKHLDENIYIKNVSVEEVDLFKINSKAIYKGEVFPASEERRTGKVLLDTTNTELAKKMGFQRTDKYMYSKSVEWDEVEIIEERKPYTLD
ncbi:hypothetical protein [Peribacillus simplex]|uniref:Uncharacterized protein n=1 Tax=Peribacillus simplex TaxID=1478 RepID=A0A9W4KXX3_9BACI|nr:hypothetical protein [Peribacillus simplex]MDR4928005.1 hypothetical protein [Peribacillus simplex]WHX91743.1 hypothetical protein QNH50_02285 [Peribacillus simplex]CAH0178061.1 hypothetical protein SRABI133_01353 [Peribacillus simplex]